MSVISFGLNGLGDGFQQLFSTDGDRTDLMGTYRFSNRIENETIDDGPDELVDVYALNSTEGRNANVNIANGEFAVTSQSEGSSKIGGSGNKSFLGEGETLGFDLQRGVGKSISFVLSDKTASSATGAPDLSGIVEGAVVINFLDESDNVIDTQTFDGGVGTEITAFSDGSFDKVEISVSGIITRLDDVQIGTFDPIKPQIAGTWFQEFKQGIGFNLLQNFTLEELQDRIEGITGTKNSDVVIGRFFGDGAQDSDIDSGAFGPDLLIGDAEGTHKSGYLGNDIIDGTNFDVGTGGDVIFGDFWDNNLMDASNDEEGSPNWKGRDIIYADGGDDLVFGQRGNDQIFGEGGNDQLFGGSGNDTINGGTGNDTLVGGDGNDRLEATAIKNGDDLLEGGAGNDVFVFANGGLDTDHVITDFTQGEDKLEIISSRYDDISDLNIVQIGFDTEITYTNRMDPGSITLKNVVASSLTNDDFVGFSVAVF